MFPETLESERLTFEQLSRDTIDVTDLYDVFGTPNDASDEVFRYVDFGPHRTLKDTYDFVARAEEQWDEGEGAKYVVRPKKTEEGDGDIAGFAGLYPDWERRFASMGIVLDKRFWGAGYAGERAELFVGVAFDTLDLEMVAVKYIDGNEQSKRAIEKYVEKLGGQYDGLLRNWVAVDEEVFDCHRYTIRREQFEAARG